MYDLIQKTEGFSESTTQIAAVETASSAIAAQAKAMVESRFVMAMHNPRNWDEVRVLMLKECSRPTFANNPSAYYIKPIGKGVEGLGIRFAEVALRCMRNVLVETTMIYEDGLKEVHRVSVTDLEANLTYPVDVKITKTIERSKPSDDGSYISVRKNSYNKNVYTVVAGDDELLNKRGALVSKALRTNALRIIPGDLQDECIERILKVRLSQAKDNPDAERQRIIDAFTAIGVTPTDLVGYLGHDIAKCSPNQMVDLRGIYGAIKNGDATWREVMDNKAEKEESKRDSKRESAPEKPEKEFYSPAQFEKNIEGWGNLIASGKKTPEAIIANVETKATLTDSQKAEIMAMAQ
jgi:hypothetical protein